MARIVCADTGWIPGGTVLDTHTAAFKTLLQILAPTNHDIELVEWGVQFDTTGSTPCRVKLARQTTAGTGAAGNCGTLSNTSLSYIDNEVAGTVQGVAAVGKQAGAWTAEPTLGTDPVQDVVAVAPASGGYRWVGRPIPINRADRLGILIWNPLAAVQVNVVAFWRE